ncbi:DUF7604 domain-containing protein [Atopobium fossor]|uniref:DUF7604 domain-containing protein n=1 Tax=Atopobium fossor TaxID=39487 RepID=UPI0003F7EB3B|nr:VWA domain-containing protein [Atopobium fossor]
MEHTSKKAFAGVCSLVVLAAVLLCMLFVPTKLSADDSAPPVHSKTLTPNSDGTYTLSLDVTGISSESSIANYKPADIVVVLDHSWSMTAYDVNGRTYWANAKEAINTLANTLLTQENASRPADKQVQVALVGFEDNARVLNSWTASKSDISSAMERVSPRGSTNWEDAINFANALDTGRPNAAKYVIFITDGDPNVHINYYVFKNGSESRHVSSDEFVQYYNDPQWEFVPKSGPYGDTTQNIVDIEDYSPEAFQAAVAAANRRNPSDKFYCISAQGKTMHLESFATKTSSMYLDGSDYTKLKASFQEITDMLVIDKYRYVDVSIKDVLSDNVEFAEGDNPTFTVTKTAADGTITQWADGTVTHTDNAVTWSLGSDYVLEEGARYTLSFKVVPKQLVYDALYDPAPDVGAGRYAGLTGFYTNDTAELTYRNRKETGGSSTTSDERIKDYEDKPVLMPELSELTITKKWQGHDATKTSIQVQVTDETANRSQIVTLTADEGWTKTIKVPAGPSGHVYTVSEREQDSDWVASYDVSVPAHSTSQKLTSRSVILKGITQQSATFSITNTRAPYAFIINKQDKTTHTPLSDAGFALYVDTDADGQFTDADQLAQGLYKDSDFIEAITGEEKTGSTGSLAFYGIQPGTYWVKETTAPAGYQLLTEPLKLVIAADGSFLLNDAPVTVQNRVGSITVEDERIQTLPSSGSSGTVLLTIVGSLAITGSCTWLFGRKRAGSEAA